MKARTKSSRRSAASEARTSTRLASSTPTTTVRAARAHHERAILRITRRFLGDELQRLEEILADPEEHVLGARVSGQGVEPGDVRQKSTPASASRLDAGRRANAAHDGP